MTVEASGISITQALIDEYGRISGDLNPLHVDPEVARATPFGGTIAHGCIPLEPVFKAFQNMLGMATLPQGCRMSLRYHRPSRPGDRIEVKTGQEETGPAYTFACTNQHGEIVINGRVILPE